MGGMGMNHAMGMGPMGAFGGMDIGMNRPVPMNVAGGPMGMNMPADLNSMFPGAGPMGMNPMGMGMGVVDPTSGMGMNMPMNMGMNMPLNINGPMAIPPNHPGSTPQHIGVGGIQQQRQQYRSPSQGPGTTRIRGGPGSQPGVGMRDQSMMTATPMQQTTYPFNMSGYHPGGNGGSGE